MAICSYDFNFINSLVKLNYTTPDKNSVQGDADGTIRGLAWTSGRVLDRKNNLDLDSRKFQFFY